MLDPTGARTQFPWNASTEADPQPRLFVDSDGVEWEVEWCDAETVRRRVPGGEGSGLVFLAKDALVFHVPMRYMVDPHLLTTSQLHSMVERAFD